MKQRLLQLCVLGSVALELCHAAPLEFTSPLADELGAPPFTPAGNGDPTDTGTDSNWAQSASGPHWRKVSGLPLVETQTVNDVATFGSTFSYTVSANTGTELFLNGDGGGYGLLGEASVDQRSDLQSPGVLSFTFDVDIIFSGFRLTGGPGGESVDVQIAGGPVQTFAGRNIRIPHQIVPTGQAISFTPTSGGAFTELNNRFRVLSLEVAPIRVLNFASPAADDPSAPPYMTAGNGDPTETAMDSNWGQLNTSSSWEKTSGDLLSETQGVSDSSVIGEPFVYVVSAKTGTSLTAHGGTGGYGLSGEHTAFASADLQGPGKLTFSFDHDVVVTGFVLIGGPGSKDLSFQLGSDPIEHFSSSNVDIQPRRLFAGEEISFTPTLGGGFTEENNRFRVLALKLAQAPQVTAAELFKHTMDLAGLFGADGTINSTPHHDGVANLLKYALNMDLGSADRRVMEPGAGTAGLPVITRAPNAGLVGVFRFEFLRRIGSGLVYTPKKSADLSMGSWMDLTSMPTVTPVDAKWERVVHDEPFDPAVTPRLFGTVEVAIP